MIISLLLTANISFGLELITITPESYLNQSSSSERKKILDFITHQSVNKSVTQAELDSLWNNAKIRKEGQLIRFQIIDQQLYTGETDISDPYFLKLLTYFKRLIQRYKIMDVDFIIYGRDQLIIEGEIDKEVINIPAFMMSKNPNAPYEKNKLLLPDAYLLRPYWSTLSQKIEKTNETISWSNKIDKIFWRGSSTGCDSKVYQSDSYSLKYIDKLPRLALVMMSKLYPDFIDAKFTAYTQFAKDSNGLDLKRILMLLFDSDSNYVTEEDHLKYKYLISLDGNTAAWLRVPWIMLSNSVLVKQEADNIEWFYSALKPYVHYVPVNYRLTNLMDQINWMKAHDQELKQISLNAQNFAKNNLMPEHIDAQVALILNEYSKIQKDLKLVPTLTKAEDAVPLSTSIIYLLKRLKNYLLGLFF